MQQIKEIFNRRVDRVKGIFDKAEGGPERITFTSADLGDLARLQKLHKKFPQAKAGCFFLYTVSLEEGTPELPGKARSAFRAAKEKDQWALSRDNESHPDSSNLYVGTSESLFNRFRYHLGTGKGKTTWSLYLTAWAQALEASFTVEYYEFSETVAHDVELIEGVLWDELQPLFGKKGGRS